VSTRIIETKAQGLLRGLIVLVDQIEGEGANRKAMVVFGWSLKLANAALRAQDTMLNPVTGSASGTRSENTGSTGDKTRAAENLTDF